LSKNFFFCTASWNLDSWVEFITAQVNLSHHRAILSEGLH